MQSVRVGMRRSPLERYPGPRGGDPIQRAAHRVAGPLSVGHQVAGPSEASLSGEAAPAAAAAAQVNHAAAPRGWKRGRGRRPAELRGEVEGGWRRLEGVVAAAAPGGRGYWRCAGTCRGEEKGKEQDGHPGWKRAAAAVAAAPPTAGVGHRPVDCRLPPAWDAWCLLPGKAQKNKQEGTITIIMLCMKCEVRQVGLWRVGWGGLHSILSHPISALSVRHGQRHQSR